MKGYRWSLGALLGLPALILLAVVLVVGGMWLMRIRRRMKKDPYDERGIVLGFAIACFTGAVITVVATAWGMWPYSAEYHQWQTTEGTVQSIDSRFVGASRSTTERFVVTFDDGRQRSCDDTRCAQVHEGDDLTLACKRAWQWSGSHGYDCNYVSHRPTR